jgi:hypothetical protein
LFYAFDVRDFSNYLHFGIGFLEISDLVIPGSVKIAVRKQVDKVLEGVNIQFLLQEISPVGANSLEIFYGCLKEIGIHITKLQIPAKAGI